VAISSGVPKRPAGIISSTPVRNSAGISSNVAVSIGPGLIRDPGTAPGEFGGPGAGEGAQSGLAGGVDGVPGDTFHPAGRAVDDDGSARGHQRDRFPVSRVPRTFTPKTSSNDSTVTASSGSVTEPMPALA
jgi:hypothetical protein